MNVDQSERMDSLDLELENIREALDWSITKDRGDKALRLFGALGWYWVIRCHFQEGVRWFRRIVTLSDKGAKDAQAKALFHAGSLYWILGDTSMSRTFLKECLNLYRGLDKKKEIADTLLSLGVVESSDGDLWEARTLLEESLAIGRQLDHKPTMSRSQFNLGDISCTKGDYLTASQQYEESLAICRQTDDSHLTTMVLLNVGSFSLEQKNNSKAREYYGEALTISLKLKNRRVTAYSLLGFSRIFFAEALFAQSARLQGFALGLLADLGAKLTKSDLADFNRIAETLKRMIGEDSYQIEFDFGKALELEQVVELALKQLE